MSEQQPPAPAITPIAFTADFKAPLRQIITDAEISAPYHPGVTPGKQPPFVPIKTLWDTGATGCSITQPLAEQLNLPQVDEVLVKHADGQTLKKVYLLNLKLLGGLIIPGLFAAEFVSEQFHMLLGMEVIRLGDFAISHAPGITTVSFVIPSQQRIDFATGMRSRTTLPNNLSRHKVGRNDLCPCGSQKKFKNCHGRDP